MATEHGEVGEKPKPVELEWAPRADQGWLRVQHLMFAVIVCAVVVWLTLTMGLWVLVLAFLLLVAGAIGLGVIFARRGSTQQESLLWALAIAAERAQPLAPAALAFADQFAGTFRARTYHLAALLEEGIPLPEASRRVTGLFSPEAETLIRVGWETGTLPQALRVAAAARASRQSAWGSVVSRFVYLGVVLLSMQVVMGFILYYITPKFQAIFNDFGLELPPTTRLTIRASHLAGRYFFLVLPLFFAEVVVLLCLPLGLFGLFRWNLPGLDFLFRRRHSALVLRGLALTAGGGKPILLGVATLARGYPSGWVRRRLLAVVREVEQGVDWAESLVDHALIRPSDAAVIASAQRAGNLAWALEELADTNERRLGYRFQLWLQMLFPILVVALGGLVCLIAVAYFSPIVRLIERLAG